MLESFIRNFLIFIIRVTQLTRDPAACVPQHTSKLFTPELKSGQQPHNMGFKSPIPVR
jgi:hypothetical protein